jgi:hypothetical protein
MNLIHYNYYFFTKFINIKMEGNLLIRPIRFDVENKDINLLDTN